MITQPRKNAQARRQPTRDGDSHSGEGAVPRHEGAEDGAVHDVGGGGAGQRTRAAAVNARTVNHVARRAMNGPDAQSAEAR